MKYIYIDESGTIDIRDKEQPIVIYSLVIIDSLIHEEVINKLKCILEEIKEEVKRELILSLKVNKVIKVKNKEYREENIKSIVRRVELHTAEFVKGKFPYNYISYEKRKNYIKRIISILDEYKIKLEFIECDKRLFSDPKLKYKNINRNISNFIDMEAIRRIKSINCESEIKIIIDLNCEIGQVYNRSGYDVNIVDSKEYIGIQIADMVAYLTREYGKNKNISCVVEYV